MKIKTSRRKGDKTETAEQHFRGKCQTSLKFEDIDEGIEGVRQENVCIIYRIPETRK
jgi:hypothetical protein